jgi:quercetin dioxygenase-like cupin family protein
VRLEATKGTFTETHCHETECLVIVLAGKLCLHLRDRAVTIRENEMVEIAAGQEHFLEALSNTVALSIATSPHEYTECGPFVREDPDQYLWGV